jgi:hypothetical protein
VTLGRSGALPREQSRGAFQVSRVATNPVARWVPNRSESTLVFRKPSPFAGRRRKGTSVVSSQRGGSLQPSQSADMTTRVLEGTFEEGKFTRQTVDPSLVHPRPAPAAEAKAFEARAARLTELSSARESAYGAPRESGEGSVATWVRRFRESGREK